MLTVADLDAGQSQDANLSKRVRMEQDSRVSAFDKDKTRCAKKTRSELK